MGPVSCHTTSQERWSGSSRTPRPSAVHPPKHCDGELIEVTRSLGCCFGKACLLSRDDPRQTEERLMQLKGRIDAVHDILGDAFRKLDEAAIDRAMEEQTQLMQEYSALPRHASRHRD